MKNFIASLFALIFTLSFCYSQETDTIWTSDLWQLGSQINQVQFTPDGQNIAVAIGGGIYIFDKVTGEIIKSFKSISGSFVFSADSKKLISSNHLNEITVWDYDKIDTLINFYNIGIQKIQLLDYNTLIGVSSNIEPDNKIYLYFLNLINGEVINKFEISDGEEIACSRKNNILALINYDYGKRYIELWDITTLTKIVILGNHTSSITDLSFSNDGKYLASASSDGIIKIWDVEKSVLLKEISFENDLNDITVRYLKFSPLNGYLVAGGGKYGYLSTKIYSMKDFSISYRYNYGATYGLDIPIDSASIAIGSGDKLYLLKAHWQPTGLNDKPFIDMLELYPNPSGNEITIPLMPGINNAEIRISNLNGQILKTITVFNTFYNKIKIVISDLLPGIYFVSVIYEDTIISYKFEKIN